VSGDDALPALGHALRVLGDRWSLAVVAALLDEPLRYGELQQRLVTIAPNVLSGRLKRLEEEGLVVARPYSQRPVRHRYELAEPARELAGALRLLAEWGARHAGLPDDAPRHGACGTPLEARWYCPSCEQLVEDDAGLRLPPDDGLLFA